MFVDPLMGLQHVAAVDGVAGDAADYVVAGDDYYDAYVAVVDGAGDDVVAGVVCRGNAMPTLQRALKAPVAEVARRKAADGTLEEEGRHNPLDVPYETPKYTHNTCIYTDT